MKNNIIEQQLKKVSIADISVCEEKDDCYVYTIKKHVDEVLEVDNYYLVRVNLEKLRSDDYAYLVNWNKVNVIPEHEYMKVDVMKKMANMIQVNGIYYDNDSQKNLDKSWSGWLPHDVIKIINKL